MAVVYVEFKKQITRPVSPLYCYFYCLVIGWLRLMQFRAYQLIRLANVVNSVIVSSKNPGGRDYAASEVENMGNHR